MIKLVNGYGIPQEGGADYQGYGDFAGRPNMRRNRLAGMALGAFYGSRMKVDPLYATLPDPAYGGYGCSGCEQRRMGGFGLAPLNTNLSTGTGSLPALKLNITGMLSTTPTGNTYRTGAVDPRYQVGGPVQQPPPVGDGAVPQIAEPINPLFIAGLGAVGIGLYMLLTKKGG